MSEEKKNPLLKEAQELATTEPPPEDPVYQQGRTIGLLSLSSRKLLPERSGPSRSDAGDDVTKIDPVGAYYWASAGTSGGVLGSGGSMHLLYLLRRDLFCGYRFTSIHSRGMSAGKWARAGALIRLTGVDEIVADCNIPYLRFAPFEAEFELSLKGNQLRLLYPDKQAVQQAKEWAEIESDGSTQGDDFETAYRFAGQVLIIPQLFRCPGEFVVTEFKDLQESAASILRRAEDEGCYVGAEGFYVN